MALPPLSLLLMFLALICAGAVADSFAVDGGQTRFARIFSFGDSLTDTGNVLRILGGRATISRPPYGETFFGRPSGRASDGRIMIDFIAEALGVPQPTPYLAGKTTADFRRGVNFAVGGGTALDPAFFEGRGLKLFVPVSLRNQTSWFKNVLERLGSVHEQRNMTATSLFVVGEIGMNDYLIGLMGNRTLSELKTFLPQILGAIHSAVSDVIAAGARTVLVPGAIPLGCEPELLTLYQGRVGAGGYDPESGCITWLNDLGELHNRELRRVLGGLRREHPGTAIVYADLYRAVTDLVVSPSRYGFRDRPLVVCCGGGGGPYNFDTAASCSAAGTTACADPSEHVFWDGVHFTEAANRRVACDVLERSWVVTEAGRRRIGCD
ncbi:GDSL esterase/lipase [Panicum miliaceum]|uniref:GDSL esterase/lipase n=1 Tax=Panicum miliaceum TaxID=4540 RepID=A0A3L6S8K6_PANMI|nr:GDSL esterase/lipase [Panicum miliaceum]